MKKETIGKIQFTTSSARGLFEAEILGQLSDGMWENSRPYDHYKFWFRLTPMVGEENKVILDEGCGYHAMSQRTGYNLSSLLPIIGDRMLKIGRMAAVATDPDVLRAAEYMPDTLTEWTATRQSGKWQYDFVKKYMDSVSADHAVAYYLTRYEMKDLKADLARVKQAIKSVAPPRHPR